MAKQTINQGTAPTGAGGDTFRTGSAKLQANDDELYAHLGASDGSLTAAKTRTALGLGTAATATITTSTTDKTTGRVLKVGDFGFGSSIPPNYSKVPDIKGFFKVSPAVADDFAHDFSGGLALPYGATEVFYLFAPVTINKPPYYRKVRNLAGGEQEYMPKQTFYTTENTTVDANGFIKNASPIVKLFADGVELNDEAQQQDIVFEKLGIGDYLIKGSSGFAQEGWYIETPKDANGNVLFSVIYTTLENGDILVKTYKKKFDLETASIVADLENPMDITAGRWIDLRLQELPQPEIEVIDEPEQ
ncbi:hypothetical protein [Acinetobacter sp. Ver3]|uniref:phage tail fiber protein n=1 Tax=Acinetobacter sp. Ver3 TaxID=466088 RepID=UPI0004471EC4|nr:hypothetical protein [Acinetobacter sp. Ver3]EZQ10726.1 tail fiber [Acinetobacter sp. Ver3]